MSDIELPGIKEPMLAAKEPNIPKMLEYFESRLPWLASPKVDGIRAFNWKGVLYSRKLKPIPNKFVQRLFGRPEWHGLDGELVVGNPWDFNCMQQTTSGVMTHGSNESDVKWFVFDDFTEPGGYMERHGAVEVRVEASDDARLRFMRHSYIDTIEDLLAYEEKCLARGYEGVMGRALDGPYKQGRSSLPQGWLVAMKRFEDAEATILEVHEQLHNANEATVNELGRTKRSGHKANKHGKGTFGAATCITPAGVKFRCGNGKGLDNKERDRLWSIRDELPGQLLKYSFLNVGIKNAPRHPKWISLRHKDDMS